MVTPRGDAPERLAWIAPSAASLVALARSDNPFLQIRHDPGAILLLLRHAPHALRTDLSFCKSRLQSPALFELSGSLLGCETSVRWDRRALRPVYLSTCRIAELSQQIAFLSEGCASPLDPEEAWAVGMLAPLGWLAMSALDPDLVEQYLADPQRARSAKHVERQQWGTDHAAIARRLARAWCLPASYLAIAGHLGLPIETASSLGADPRLFQTVQLAVALFREQDDPLRLPCGGEVIPLAAALSLTPAHVELLEAAARRLVDEELPPLYWQAPSASPLLQDVLAMAAEVRRLRQAPLVEVLERKLDCLQSAVEVQEQTFVQRLEDDKLGAMAEFAAGAGHEINNPLAVISGQAQYLIRSVEEETPVQRLLQDGNEGSEHGAALRPPSVAAASADRSVLRISPARLRDSLQKVVCQVQRIHDLLRQLMQFARPARPQKVELDVVGLVHEVLTAHRDLADERQVRVDAPSFGPQVLVFADPNQLRTVFSCLVKNAIEAAGQAGWMAVRLECDEIVNIVVEDSGHGPDRRQRDHLFEPFYSGREAGRGHGLGLSMAWRLAREQGGSVQFFPRPHGPTRFVVTLPLHNASVAEPAHYNGFASHRDAVASLSTSS